MLISLSEAKGRLTNLVRRAEAGDEVILTRHGQPVVRLVPTSQPPVGEARWKILKAALGSGAATALPGPSAARSQDFLYDDETGLPR